MTALCLLRHLIFTVVKFTFEPNDDDELFVVAQFSGSSPNQRFPIRGTRAHRRGYLELFQIKKKVRQNSMSLLIKRKDSFHV